VALSLAGSDLFKKKKKKKRKKRQRTKYNNLQLEMMIQTRFQEHSPMF